MRLRRGSIVVLLLVPATIAGGGLNRSARADAMAESWSGASASVSFLDQWQQSQSQQGPTAYASAGGSVGVDYQGSPAYQIPTFFHAVVSGNVSASAGGDPAHLLQVTASGNSPNPGTLGGPTLHGASATASWTNDAAIVTAPVGSSLPDTVRLNFTLTFSAPGEYPYQGLTATYNGTNLTYSATGWSGVQSGSSRTGAVDSSTLVNDGPYNDPTTVKDTFHIDLPLSKSGLSAPFSLSLQLWPTMGLTSNAPLSYSGLLGNIALTSVTLPDGTPLSAPGDSVSFESGLPAPNAVPEPSPLIAWSLIAAAAGVTVFRRSRSAHQGPSQ